MPLSCIRHSICLLCKPIDCFQCDDNFSLIIYIRYSSYQQLPNFQYLKGTPESELRPLKISNRAADYHFLRQGKNTDVSVNETLLCSRMCLVR